MQLTEKPFDEIRDLFPKPRGRGNVRSMAFGLAERDPGL